MSSLDNFAASYSGYVGDEFTLSEPSVSILAKKIKSVTWSGTYADGISCYEMTGYLKVRITSYFESLITINCDVAYEWESNGGTYTGHSRESYTIRCNPVEIIVNNPNMTLEIGQEKAISYELSPSKNARLTFTSDNYSVATVDDLGYVKAVSAGSARITINQDMGYSAYCYVTVENPVEATSISLPATASVTVYSSTTLYPTFEPSEASPALTWESDDTSIASVDQSGKVTGNNPGTATITATTDNGLSASCVVTVNDVDRTPRLFTIPEEFSEKTVYVGDSWKVVYTIEPSYANYTLNWTSSDETVATVSSYGVVNAIRQGTARITGSVEGSYLSDYCDVTVKGIPNVLSIWLLSGERVDIKLNENISMTFAGEKFIIKYGTMNVEYDAYDVKKFTLESDGTEEPGVIKVDAQAIVDIVSSMMNKAPEGFNKSAADANGDGKLTIADIVQIANMIINSK